MKTFSKYIIRKLLECRNLTIKYGNQINLGSDITVNGDIIAIGDIHGDIQLMLDTLLIGGVIQLTNLKDLDAIKIFRKDKDNYVEYYKWIGENKIVVQVGDQIDRCRAVNREQSNCMYDNVTYDDEASDIEILLFFSKLHLRAQAKGGAVYSLFGNHELSNILGDIRYVSHENLMQLKIEDRKDSEDPGIKKEIETVITSRSNLDSIDHYMQRRRNIFRPSGILAKFLGSTRYSILIVNGYLFVHGGVLESFIQQYTVFLNKDKIQFMSDQTNKNINRKVFDFLNRDVQQYISSDKESVRMENFIITTEKSPFNTRDLTLGTKGCEYVQKIIDEYNLKGIIIGHTPQTNGINSTCNIRGKNRLFKIDVASSKAFYIGNSLAQAQVLKINNDDTTEVLKFKNGIDNMYGIISSKI